jgi:hypothetical protein
MLCQAAMTKITNNNIIDRQRRNVESTKFLVDSKFCLGSEIDHQVRIEEAESNNTFDKFYKLFDLFTVNSLSKNIF